jgi:DNA-binding winged helix-turn-helix (wHTH) protein
MARRLFVAGNEPKEIVTIPGAGHAIHDDVTFEIINRWIDRQRAIKANATR